MTDKIEIERHANRLLDICNIEDLMNRYLNQNAIITKENTMVSCGYGIQYRICD